MRKKILVSIMIFLKDIEDDGFKIWTQVRDEAGPLFGKLEFPGGKIEIWETPLDAVDREVEEEVGVDISTYDFKQIFKIQNYTFNEKDIVLYVFISNFDKLPKDKGQWLDIKFNQKSAYLKDKIPEINHVIIDELAVYLEKINNDRLLDLLWTISK